MLDLRYTNCRGCDPIVIAGRALTGFFQVIARLLYPRRFAPRSCSESFRTASSASDGVRAPVQTSLPLPNSSITTLGSSIRQTRPGNCPASYSTRSRPNVTATELRLMTDPRSELATMF